MTKAPGETILTVETDEERLDPKTVIALSETMVGFARSLRDTKRTHDLTISVGNEFTLTHHADVDKKPLVVMVMRKNVYEWTRSDTGEHIVHLRPDSAGVVRESDWRKQMSHRNAQYNCPDEEAITHIKAMLREDYTLEDD